MSMFKSGFKIDDLEQEYDDPNAINFSLTFF